MVEKAVPFKIDGVYCRLIPLSRGLYAIVWESDYEWLMQWKWHAYFDKKGRCWYAARNTLARHGKRHSVSMTREIMGLGIGDQREVDHKNTGDTLDNRRSNLRICEHRQNSRNRRRNSKNSSGIKGVYIGIAVNISGSPRSKRMVSKFVLVVLRKRVSQQEHMPKQPQNIMESLRG